MTLGKKQYLEQLLEARPDAEVYIIFDPRTPGCVPRTRSRAAAIVLPLRSQQVTFAGVSGALVRSGTYVFVPWAAVTWIGRDWGTPAAIGLAYPRAGVRPEPELSGPRTVGVA